MTQADFTTEGWDNGDGKSIYPADVVNRIRQMSQTGSNRYGEPDRADMMMRIQQMLRYSLME